MAWGHASLESQLGSAPCLCEDTEEMFWLRESDDYGSRVRLGNLLAGQYRFRDALDAYRSAEAIRGDDPALFLRIGGTCLTLLRLAEAKAAYNRSRTLAGNDKSVAFPMGVWHYMRGDYAAAADRFASVLPCGGETEIAVLYWHALSCIRGCLPDRLLETYRDDMDVGHHVAYREAVKVLLGRISAETALLNTARDKNDLDAAISLYAIAACLARSGMAAQSDLATAALLERTSVWPCIPYLAAWNDQHPVDNAP